MPDRFVVVPAAYVFLLRSEGGADRVLLQRRGEVPYMAGHWAAGAAGHVEAGETVVQGALREAREELGLASVDLSFLCVMHRRGGEEPIEQRIDFFFTARSWAGVPVLQEPGKATGLDWFPLTALPEPMVPHEAYVLSRLAAGTVEPLLTFGF